MVKDYMLDKVLDKIKEMMGIEKSNDTKILIEIDNKLSDDLNLENCCDTNYMHFKRCR